MALLTTKKAVLSSIIGFQALYYTISLVWPNLQKTFYCCVKHYIKCYFYGFPTPMKVVNFVTYQIFTIWYFCYDATKMLLFFCYAFNKKQIAKQKKLRAGCCKKIFHRLRIPVFQK